MTQGDGQERVPTTSVLLTASPNLQTNTDQLNILKPFFFFA